MEAIIMFVVLLGLLGGIGLQAGTSSSYVIPEAEDWHK